MNNTYRICAVAVGIASPLLYELCPVCESTREVDITIVTDHTHLYSAELFTNYILLIL